MTDASFDFESPRERRPTVYLEHVAGFEVSDVEGATTFVTAADLEKDADGRPIFLRKVLAADYKEVTSLSGEYLLRNLVIPNLPLGFYGDKEDEPTILSAGATVHEPGSTEGHLEYAKEHGNTVSVELVPILGKLAHISCIREPQLGGYGIDWITADRQGCFVSLFGGLLQAHILYDRHE